MPQGTTQFGDGGGLDDPGVWMDTTPTLGPEGPPTRATHDPRTGLPLPFEDAALAFPQFAWSTGEPIPGALLEWLRGTVGPLANWFTRTNEDFPGTVGNIRDWAKNPMAAWAGAGIPQALNQAIFDYGVKQMRDVYGMGTANDWSPGGNAYSLWSTFLGMDHPTEVSGQMPQTEFDVPQAATNVPDISPVPPNPQLPNSPTRVDPDMILKMIAQRNLTPPGGGPPGPVPNPGRPPFSPPGGGPPGPVPNPVVGGRRYLGPPARNPTLRDQLLSGLRSY